MDKQRTDPSCRCEAGWTDVAAAGWGQAMLPEAAGTRSLPNDAQKDLMLLGTCKMRPGCCCIRVATPVTAFEPRHTCAPRLVWPVQNPRRLRTPMV